MRPPMKYKYPPKRVRDGRLEGFTIDRDLSNPQVRNIELLRIDRNRALPQPPSRRRNWGRLGICMGLLLLLLTCAITGTVAGILAKRSRLPSNVTSTPLDKTSYIDKSVTRETPAPLITGIQVFPAHSGQTAPAIISKPPPQSNPETSPLSCTSMAKTYTTVTRTTIQPTIIVSFAIAGTTTTPIVSSEATIGYTVFE
ncbi:hypothetical protein BD779DRAFT_1541834 [Infundibulicybe gibba]|nr:hypothetical protein BD779DRAFT_1541834 [Infundibulicybe gibba]